MNAPGALGIALIHDGNGSGVIDAGAGWTSLLVDTGPHVMVEHQLFADAGIFQVTATMPNGDADWAAIAAELLTPRVDAGETPDGGDPLGATGTRVRLPAGGIGNLGADRGGHARVGPAASVPGGLKVPRFEPEFVP